MNYDWTQSLLFVIIQKPMEKSYRLFVENQFHANSQTAYRVTS